jgi:ATP-binding cassette, subfamily F, member 3
MFAVATIDKPHFLILDEPTNHLDVDSREALIHAINDYEGAVLLISHDRHILEACVDRLWIVADGDVKSYDGDLDDYKKLLLAERSSNKREKNAEKSQDNDGKQKDKKARRIAAAQRREALAPLKEKAKKAEQYIERLNVEKDKVSKILADGTLYRNNDIDKARLARLQGEAGKIDKAIEQAEAKWMALTEEYDKTINAG